MKKQSIYFLVIIILLVQTSCQQNNEEEDFFNNQITLLENNPRLYLSKIDSTQVTNLNNSKEATHFLLVSLANYYVNNYYPPKEVLQKSIHIFTKKKLIQQQLESLLFLAKTYKKEKNLKMEVQAIEKAIDIASQIEDKEWLCCLYGYLGDMYIRKYNMLKFIKYQTLANQCIEDIAFRDMDISTQVQTAKSFLYTSFPQQDNPPHGYRIFLSASTHLQGRWGSCTHDRDKGSCGHRCISSTSS